MVKIGRERLGWWSCAAAAICFGAATAIVARLFFREDIGKRPATGIGLVLLAGVLVAGFSGAHVAFGAVLVAGACVCWGIDNALTSNLDSYSPANITLAKGVVAGTVNLALGLTLETTPHITTVIAAAAIGSVGYGLSITLWVTGARLIGAARGQTVLALAPFVGATLAWPILGEHLTGRTIAAFAIALTGVMIVATSRHGHRHTHDAIEHAHAIDPDDPHHQPGAIEPIDADRHRHLVLAHEHPHVPDVHHRHHH